MATTQLDYREGKILRWTLRLMSEAMRDLRKVKDDAGALLVALNGVSVERVASNAAVSSTIVRTLVNLNYLEVTRVPGNVRPTPEGLEERR